MREVNYIVQESGLIPEKVIYAGTISVDKEGVAMWKSRGEVTDMAINSVLRHMVAKTSTKNPSTKGMKYSFENVNGYDIEIIVKKREESNEKA